MQINIISILSLAVLILYLEMGLYVFFKNPSAALNRWFFMVSVVFALWSFGHVIYVPDSSLFGGYPYFAFSAAAAFLYLPILIRFVSLLTDLPRSQRQKVWGFRILFAMSASLVAYMLLKPGGIEQIFFVDRFNNTPAFSLFILASYAYQAVSMFLLFFLLLWWRRGMSRTGEIAQFNIIFYPLAISFAIGLINDLILPMSGVIGLNNLSHIYSVFWMGGVAYGMMRQRFFALTPALAAEQVIGRTSQVLFFCSLNGNITRTNSFTSGLLRLRNSDIIGQSVSSFFAEERELKKFVDWALSNGYSGPAELSLRSAQGEYIAVNISLTLVKDRFNDVMGLMVYGQDNREAIKLRNEIIIRQQIENKLRSMSEVLEARVKERSNQLTNSYKERQIRITERLKVEEKIKADIAEKEVLINEIHNRVKNNMNLIIALINANISKDNPRKVNQKFSQLAQRVRAILLVHYHLYLSINYSEVDFSGFLRMLMGQLADFYQSQDKVEIELNLSEIFLDIDHAIPLGIIVNEIISNSLSHAFNFRGRKKAPFLPPKLTINFFQDDSQCFLEVIDNGKGLPRKFDVNNLQTNGLPLVELLVKDQVNGVLEIEQNAGTTVKIVFPIGESQT